MRRAARLKRLSALEQQRGTVVGVTRYMVAQDENGQLREWVYFAYTLANGVKTIIELPDNGRRVGSE